MIFLSWELSSVSFCCSEKSLDVVSFYFIFEIRMQFHGGTFSVYHIYSRISSCNTVYVFVYIYIITHTFQFPTIAVHSSIYRVYPTRDSIAHRPNVSLGPKSRQNRSPYPESSSLAHGYTGTCLHQVHKVEINVALSCKTFVLRQVR